MTAPITATPPTWPERPFWAARDQARLSSNAMYAELRKHLGLLPHATAGVIQTAIEQAMADEYEAGYEAGYAQRPPRPVQT